MTLQRSRSLAGSPFQHFTFAASISHKDGEGVFSKVIVPGNLLYDPVSFVTGNSVLCDKMFQQISDTCQIRQLEFLFLIICHIPHFSGSL